MQASTFKQVISSISKTIPFNPKWANGTGYFNNACHLVRLQPGERATSIDPSGRAMVLIGTRFGTCVFFERYTPSNTEDIIVVSNLPHRLRLMLPSGAVDGKIFSHYTDGDHNIGFSVENLFSLTKRDMMNDALQLAEPGKA